MHQLPATVWNRIAETQQLATPWAQHLFSLDQEALDKALTKQERQLKLSKVPPATISSFQQMAPLLWEHEAIAAFVRQNPDLHHALPEVLTPREAAAVAAKDRELDEDESLALVMLLEA